MRSEDDSSNADPAGVDEHVSEDGCPRAFFSYSWNTQAHRERIRLWADRLIGDGVEVVLDVYDLKQGHDKYAFMEQMVTDDSVSHVLVFCDREYARKADERSSGVGVESQIISQEIYEKVKQSKFIPIVCEFDDSGEPILPTFMKSLIWIDFSSEEKANEFWEVLIRLLYNRPLHSKPRLGSPPKYLEEEGDGNSETMRSRLASLKSAVLSGGRNIKVRRSDFIDECIRFADELRVRAPPEEKTLGQKVLDDCRGLMVVRNAFVEWILLEADVLSVEELSPILIEALERLLEMKARPSELNQWKETWFEAHSVFVYETFLYVVASLIRAQGFDVIGRLFAAHYLLPENLRWGEGNFGRFDRFYGHSSVLSDVLRLEDDRAYLSPAAELIKRQATRSDIAFISVMEAELLVFLKSLLEEGLSWYPDTALYAQHSWKAPLFLKATRRGDFANLSRVLGIEDADMLRRSVRESLQLRLRGSGTPFGFAGQPDLLGMMNLDGLDTLS